MIREVSYDAIKCGLKTGDLILFHGEEMSSKIIECVEWSFWSHVGMVILPKDMGLNGDEPLLWESTSSSDGIVDVILKEPKASGAMLVPLSERIQVDVSKKYDTHFKVKYLNQALDASLIEILKQFVLKMHHRTFPTDIQMITYYLEGVRSNKPSPETTVFCSQLTAETLMTLGFISNQYVSNGYCPKDFDTFENMPKIRPFYYMEGARFK